MSHMSTLLSPSPLPRIEKFERLGYGLFLHWGLYSQLGQGEWALYHGKQAIDDYARLIEKFDAAHFDAPAIARTAKTAGMRYAVLTTRHHEGFSLYDTRGLSPFDAPHSPAGRDLVAEFATACRAEGIVPFFYHTTLDWSRKTDTCSDADFDSYLDYLHDSVEILCRHYGPVGGFWFDGNWSRPDANWREDRLYATIRRHQPETIIINNTGIHARGQTGHPEIDSITFEQGLPSAPDRRGWTKYLAGEMCETLNLHWGIGGMDFNFKSPTEIIRNLCSCRKAGANYLLNVGPTAAGAIPDYERALLGKVGQWISLHGDLIYEGRPTGIRCQGNDFVLSNHGRFYYFAYDVGRRGSAHVVTAGGLGGPRQIEHLPKQLTSARWLDNSEIAALVPAPDGTSVTLPCDGYDYGHDLVVRVAELS